MKHTRKTAIGLAFSAAATVVGYWQLQPDMITQAEKSVAQVEIGDEAGTAFLVDKKGYMLTCAHVASDTKEPIIVQFSDGKKIPAVVVAYLPDIDASVLKISGAEAKHRPVLSLSTRALKVGEPVIEIGNPFNIGLTVTEGVVSALNKQSEDNKGLRLFQFSAATNPGNSGGVVLNKSGEVLGMAEAIISTRSNPFGGGIQNSGISFAVPASYLKVMKDYAQLVEAKPDAVPVGKVNHPVYRRMELGN